MTKGMVLDVAWIGPSSNKMYAGQHWSKRKKQADTGHLLTLAAVRDQFPKAKTIDGPVHLTFTPHHNHRRDPDNYSFAVKVIIDGLVEAGLLWDDTDEFITGITLMARRKSKENFMRVEIREVTDEG